MSSVHPYQNLWERSKKTSTGIFTWASKNLASIGVFAIITALVIPSYSAFVQPKLEEGKKLKLWEGTWEDTSNVIEIDINACTFGGIEITKVKGFEKEEISLVPVNNDAIDTQLELHGKSSNEYEFIYYLNKPTNGKIDGFARIIAPDGKTTESSFTLTKKLQ